MKLFLTFIKQIFGNLEFVIVCVTMIILGFLFIEINNLEKQLIKCEADLRELIYNHELELAVAKAKAEAANQTIQKEVIKYIDRIQYVNSTKKDNNKSDCDNAISLLRSNF